MISIIIADDHAVVREGLKRILSDIHNYAVDEAQTCAELLEKTRDKKYDLVLLDISMPDKSGVEVLKQLKDEQPGLPVLILTIYPEEQYAVQMLKAGASGYLTKTSAPEELIKAIHRVIEGKIYVNASVAEMLASKLKQNTGRLPHEMLSGREYEVFCLIASGKRNKDIAHQLSVSEKTVSTYRSRLLEKMEMQNNAEVIRYALKHNLLNTHNSATIK